MAENHAPIMDDRIDREVVIDALLGELEIEQAYVVRLHYFHGKTLKQIGALLRGGKTPERVRCIEAQAIRRMQKRVYVLFPTYANIMEHELQAWWTRNNPETPWMEGWHPNPSHAADDGELPADDDGLPVEEDGTFDWSLVE